MKAPESLSRAGRKFYRKMAGFLADAGVLDRVDEPALELLCVQWERIQEAREVLRRDGTMTVGYRGQPVQHPALRAEREAVKLFQSLASEFGLTPTGRGRLGISGMRGRSLQQELDATIGRVELRPVPGT